MIKRGLWPTSIMGQPVEWSSAPGSQDRVVLWPDQGVAADVVVRRRTSSLISLLFFTPTDMATVERAVFGKLITDIWL